MFGEPLRTAVTICGVALGVAVYVAVATANVEVLRSFEEAVLGVAGRTTLQVSGGTLGLGGFDETVIQTIRHTDGVTRTTPVLEITATWSGVGGGPADAPPAPTIPILGVDLLEESSFRDYKVADQGQTEADWERYLDPDAIFVGRRLAERYGIAVGSVLDVRAGTLLRLLVVRGLLVGEGPGRSTLEELAVMDIAAAQWTFNRLGKLDRVDIVTDPAVPVEEVRRGLQARLPPGLVVNRPEQRNAQVERMTRAFRMNIVSLSAVALLVGLFLIYNSMSFAVVRRRREIGILRAVGASPAGVRRLFLAEAVMLGVIGGAIGLALGVVLAQGAVRTIAASMGHLYDVRTLPHPPGIPGGVLVQSWIIGVGVAVIGSLGPIREAGAVVPAQALAPRGYEAAGVVRVGAVLTRAGGVFVLAGLAALPGPIRGLPVFGYLSAFLLMVGFAWLSPVVLRMIGPGLRAILPRRAGCLAQIAAGELDRAPVRNAVAVSAFMVGLALMIGMSVMIHSFRLSVDLWLDQTVKADVIVASPTWLGESPEGILPESVRARLRDLPGVVAADGYRDLRMEFRGMPVAVVARDLLLHARHSRYLFMEGESTAVLTEAVRKDQAVVSETFARQFDLRRGDRLALPGPQGPVEFSIAGVFYDYSTDGGKIVIDRGLYEQHWGDRSSTVVPLYLVPGADPEAVRRAVAERLAGDPPVMILTNGELKREVLRIFDQTFRVTYALEIIAVAVALLGIINTLLSGILERRRDLAVFRAIGGTASQIGRLILWESGLLGLAGTMLGVAAGLALAVLLIEVINKQSFGWTILFHPAPGIFLQAVGLALLTTVLAGFWPALRAARLPVADGLRYE